MEFDEEQLAKDFLLSRLPDLGTFNSSMRSEVLDQLSAVFKHYDFPSGRGDAKYMSFMVPRIYWVIRNEDLPIVESFINGFATAATVGFFAPGTLDQSKLAASAAGLIATCYKLFKSMTGKGKFLSQLDYKILLCLKNNVGGLDPQRLANMLNLTKETVTLKDVEDRLKNLQSVHTADGSKKELIFIEDKLYKVRGI